MDATARIEIERDILASILLDPPRYLPIVEPVLNGGAAFASSENRAMYGAMNRIGPNLSAPLLLGELPAKHPDDPSPGPASRVNDLLDRGASILVTPDRLTFWAQTIEAERVREQLRGLLAASVRSLSEGADESEVLAALTSEIEKSRADSTRGRVLRDMALADFQAYPFDRKPSLVGTGLLTAGGLGVLYGQAGRGKSYLLLQLAVAVAMGRPWVGIPTVKGRVGVVSLELEGYQLQDRMAAVVDAMAEGVLPDGIFLHCRDTLRGLLDVGQAKDQEELIAWVKARKLDLLILDPLSRIHCLEETAAELGRIVLPFLDRLRIETKAAVMLAHHERKAPQGVGKGAEDDLEALRGTTRLQSDPTVLFRLKTSPDGKQTILKNPKANHGQEHAPLYLERGEGGTFGRVDAPPEPERMLEVNRKKVRDAVWNSAEGIRAADIAAQIGMSTRTVNRHLLALGIRPIGQGPSAIYRIEFNVDSAPNTPEVADELNF